MKLRIVDVALLLATIGGAVVAISTARTLHSLQSEHARLGRTVGALVITDPAQVHVQALETGEPFHFAWRVYTPAGQISISELIGDRGRSSGTDHASSPHEFIARIRFTEGSDQTVVYSSFRSGSSRWSFGSAEMLRFLIEHYQEVKIEQLGAGETARLKPGQSASVLKIIVPESLAAQADKAFSDPNATRLIPNVFECRMELKP